MKHISQFIFRAACLFLFISCSSEKEGISQNQIAVGEAVQEVESSGWIEKIEAVKVSGTLIGRVGKIAYHAGCFVILDMMPRPTLAVLDSSGQFLYRIGQEVADSTGLPVTISDFDIDTHASRILVLDGQNQRIMSYSLTGEPLGDILLARYYSHLKVVSSDRIALFKNKMANNGEPAGPMHDLVIIDALGKPQSAFRPFEIPPGAFSRNAFNAPFSDGNGAALYTEFLQDTIWEITGDRLVPKYEMDYGKKSLPTEIKQLPANQLRGLLTSGQQEYCFGATVFLVSDDLLAFQYISGGKKLFSAHITTKLFRMPTPSGIAIMAENCLFLLPLRATT